ncbi:MAG: LUD domain-containing protein, partial [Planctomycetes bacterium]|nr:LUD domain-containing protein [Planctomycetota bacterium]
EAKGEFSSAVARAELPAAIAKAAPGARGYARGAALLLGEQPAPAEPAELAGLPWMVATALCAVARAGAVAIDAACVPVRLQLLLPENLLVLVREDAIVTDLADFYRGIDAATLAGGYLALIGGPSRTADIEQTLVTGAHGPRRFVVLPYRP